VFITVGICTFNRAESLRRTLDSLVAMRLPSDVAWEIVIVNNNSTDHTDDIISRYASLLPVRREFEPRAGKSNALNRAIDVAKGDYIVWIDDDVLVDAGWLTAYVEAFRRWPEAAVFGGRITPRYESPVENWIKHGEAFLIGPYGIRDFGDHVLPLSADDEYHFPFGANWAIRAIEQRAFRYDPQLGPVGKRYRTHEETYVMRRILGAGATGFWIPEATVEHCVRRDMQTVRYIAAYYEGLGESVALLTATATAAAPFWFGIPRRIWPRLLVSGVLYRFCRFVSPAPVWLKYLRAYSRNKGMRRYWLQKRIETHRKAKVETAA
jgi:glycosyltransferase involved in cell wall biosynthesis